MISQVLDPQFLLALAKVTAILVAALALAPLIKRPDLRASFWMISILSLPVVFVCSFSFSVLELIPREKAVAENLAPIAESKPVSKPAPFVLSESDSTPLPVEAMETMAQIVAEPEVVEQPAQIEAPSEFPWLAIAYLSGALLVLAPWLMSFLQLSFLRKTSATGMPREIWQSLFARLSLKAELKFTPSPSAPFASGLMRPSILIPENSVDWNPRRLQSVLLHEAAHLKRRDPLTRFFSSVVKALFWFHPLAWLAHRQLISAQEQACDQFALTHGIAPTDYAEDLLHSATHSQTTPSEALAMARWSQLGNRIRHILNTKTHSPSTVKQITMLCSIFAIAAIAITSVGYATEKNQAVQAEGFLSAVEIKALDTIEKFEGKYGVKHPKYLAERKKIPNLKVFLVEKGKNSWQLTTGPHLYGKDEVPKELSRLSKLVPDLLVELDLTKEAKLENLLTLLESLREVGANNIKMTTAVGKKKAIWPFGMKKAAALVQIHPLMLTVFSVDFLEVEMAKCGSPEVLYLANRSLKLGFESEDEAVEYLKNYLSVDRVRGTDLIKISAYHKERATAVEIANAVAKAFGLNRNKVELARSQEALAALDQELEDQARLVAKNRDVFIELLPKSGDKPGLVQLDLGRKESRLEKLQTAKKAGDLARMASLEGAGNQVPEYYQVYQKARERVDLILSSGLGARHPEVVALRGQAERALKNFTAEVDAVEKQLKADIDRLKWMRATYDLPDDLKGESLKAKEAYQQARKLLQEMETKQQVQRDLLKMPRTPVTIHELAK